MIIDKYAKWSALVINLKDSKDVSSKKFNNINTIFLPGIESFIINIQTTFFVKSSFTS